jgi:hypothetical protein
MSLREELAAPTHTEKTESHTTVCKPLVLSLVLHLYRCYSGSSPVLTSNYGETTQSVVHVKTAPKTSCNQIPVAIVQ